MLLNTATPPVKFVEKGAADLAVTGATLRGENDALRKKNLQLSLQANTASELNAENSHLRSLLQLSQRMTTQSIPAEIQYDTRDPFTQKVIIGRGGQQGIQDGSPVVSEDGVIGQVTRVFPMQAEVTLLTDKDQAVPVQVVRTGLRSVIYGTPKGDSLDLRFVPISADVQAGDELVTSGLDGTYPPGLPVAKVVRRQAGRYRIRTRDLPAGRAGARRAPVAGAALSEQCVAASRGRARCSQRCKGREGEEGCEGRGETGRKVCR